MRKLYILSLIVFICYTLLSFVTFNYCKQMFSLLIAFNVCHCTLTLIVSIICKSVIDSKDVSNYD